MEVTLTSRARATVIWIGVALLIIVLVLARHALAPFVWAVISAYLFHPIVAFIQRKTRLPKQIVALAFYIMLGFVVYTAVMTVVPLLVHQSDQVQRQLIPEVMRDVDTWVEERQKTDPRFENVDIDAVNDRIRLFGRQAAELVGTEAVPLLFSTLTFAIELFIFLFSSFYLVVFGPRFMQTLRDAINRKYHREFDRLMSDVNTTLGAYLRGQALLVVIMSTASYIALRILGVDYALSVAVATGFLELIPLIGPWTAGAIAVTIALFQTTAPFGWSNTSLALVIGLIYFALRQLEDAFVIPLVIGRFVHLNPFTVIFVLVTGTALAGPLGLILSVPIAAVAKIIIQFFHAKIIARSVRQIEPIRSAEQLRQVAATFPNRSNAAIVLMIEPGALTWSDLPLVQETLAIAEDTFVILTAVTPDGVAGSLTTAVGIPTVSLPTTPLVPAAAEPEIPLVAAQPEAV
ncbi:MAG: AI-2E family transporter [Thermomicrobiales bacterium]